MNGYDSNPSFLIASKILRCFNCIYEFNVSRSCVTENARNLFAAPTNLVTD